MFAGCAWYAFFFFFNDTATTEIYTLSLHDALPISYTFGYDKLQHHRITWLSESNQTVMSIHLQWDKDEKYLLVSENRLEMTHRWIVHRNGKISTSVDRFNITDK